MSTQPSVGPRAAVRPRRFLRCLAAFALAGCNTASPEHHASTAQALTVTPAFELDSAASEPAGATTSSVRSAFNGTDHLAAWVDASGVVMMTRVSAAGVVRDPLGVVLGPSPAANLNSSGNAPSVASDGAGFLVAWVARNGEVRAARVDGAGEVLDPGGFVVTTGAALGANPVAVGSASGYLVAWRDGRNASTTGVDYFASRISRAGVVLDPAGLPALVAPGDQTHASLATNGAGWLIACEDPGSDVRVGRLDASGVALDGAGRRVAVTVRQRVSPSVAFNGTSYLLAWADVTTSGSLTPGLYAQIISPAGAVVGAEAIALGVTAASAAAAPDGSGWLVAGGGTSSVSWTRVSAAGAVVDAPARSVTARVGGRPALSGSGGPAGHLFASALFRVDASVNAFAQRIAADGSAAGAVFDLNFRAPLQDSPAVASDGASFLFTWRDGRAGTGGYRAQRLSPTGVPVGATLTLPASISAFAATFGGSSYLLGWYDVMGANHILRTAPLSVAGALGASVAFDPAVSFSVPDAPSLAAGGGRYAIARSRFGGSGGGGFFSASVRMLGSDGAPGAGSASSVSSTALNGLAPSISFDGANFLAAYVDSPTADPGARCMGARARRFTPAGDRLETAPITLSGAACDVTATADASDGTNHLVVWTSPAGLFAARVSTAGSVLDATPRTVSSMSAGSPVASFDGTDFVVAWVSSRSGNADIFAARVSRAGDVLDPGGVAVSQEPVTEEAPAMVSTSTGRTLVAYVRRTSTTAARVRGRFVTFNDVPVSDAGPADAAADAVIVVDTGVVADAGSDATTDALDVPAVTVDAGHDAGSAVDVGTPTDVATATDVPTATDASTPPDDDGGGCSVGHRRPVAPGVWGLALFALALLRRNRRRLATRDDQNSA